MIASPPAGLADLDLHVMPARSLLYRVHAATRGPVEANPCLGRPSRFAPLWVDGRCVPTLYAASDLGTAAYETVFHDVPAGPGRRIVLRQQLLDRAVSTLRLAAPLRLVPLFAPELARLGVERSATVDTPPRTYPATVAWAAAVWRRQPQAQGLIWTSRRADPGLACLLFAPRLLADALVPTATRAISVDPDLVMELVGIAARAGIDIA